MCSVGSNCCYIIYYEFLYVFRLVPYCDYLGFVFRFDPDPNYLEFVSDSLEDFLWNFRNYVFVFSDLSDFR